MKGVQIISFDGLNRSGKGTQLRLIRKHLEDCMQNVMIVRGDGSREGIDNPEYFDPPSIWWRRWQSNKNKTPQDWDNAYLILNKETEDEFEIFRYKHNFGFFLMDRCYISRWFVERQKNRKVLFDDVVKNTQIFPNKYFILDVPKKILLSRANDDNPKKAQFRKQIIEQWYDLWLDTLDRVQEKLGDRIIRLDATKDKHNIHKEIIKNIDIYK